MKACLDPTARVQHTPLLGKHTVTSEPTLIIIFAMARTCNVLEAHSCVFELPALVPGHELLGTAAQVIK